MLGTSNDIRNPGLRTLPPGVERYFVKGGGLSVIEIFPEDKIEIINDEGKQICELIAFDAQGKPDLSILNLKENANADFSKKAIANDKKITKIQGGTYSSSRNKLLIASDAGTRKGGVFQIDLTTFTAKKEIEIRYNRGFPAYQEIEGLTFNDRKDDSKVTVLMLDNNLVEDSMQFIEVSNFW